MGDPLAIVEAEISKSNDLYNLYKVVTPDLDEPRENERADRISDTPRTVSLL
jgi:hypothetical protein